MWIELQGLQWWGRRLKRVLLEKLTKRILAVDGVIRGGLLMSLEASEFLRDKVECVFSLYEMFHFYWLKSIFHMCCICLFMILFPSIICVCVFMLGVKGVYSSRTIEGATQFLQQYTSCLNARYNIPNSFGSNFNEFWNF